MFTSLVFALMLQGSYYSEMFEDLSRHVGPALVEQEVLFQHQVIDFEHQHWRIRTDTVCSQHQINPKELRQCQKSAAQFFEEACYALGQHMFEEPRYTKPRNMFCTAANTYRPAKPDSDAEREKQIAELRQQCKALVDATTLRYNPKALKQRKKICSDYRRLSAVQ